MKDVAEEEGSYGAASGESFRWRLRLEEIVLQQFDAAGHGRVLDREEALTLGKHVRHAVLHKEGEVWEPVREGDGDVPATAAHVDDSAIEGVPLEQVTECDKFAVHRFLFCQSLHVTDAVRRERGEIPDLRTARNTGHGLGEPSSVLGVLLVVLKHGGTKACLEGRMREVGFLRRRFDGVGRRRGGLEHLVHPKLPGTPQVLVPSEDGAGCRVREPCFLDLPEDAMRAQHPQHLARPTCIHARLASDFFHGDALFRLGHNREEVKLERDLEGSQVVAETDEAAYRAARPDDEQP